LIAAGTLTSAATPTITGATRVGSTLIAIPGNWDAGTTFTYQWYRGASPLPITGAINSSYVLTPADQGSPLSVRVTGAKPAYKSVTVSSNATAPVAAG
jgi:hypothetical protein